MALLLARITLTFDTIDGHSIEERTEIENALNAACSMLEQSDIRDPKGSGVSYRLSLEEI